MLKSILTNKVIATDPVAIKNRQIPTHSFLKKVYLDLIHNTHLKLDPSIRSTDPEWEWATLDILDPRYEDPLRHPEDEGRSAVRNALFGSSSRSLEVEN